MIINNPIILIAPAHLHHILRFQLTQQHSGSHITLLSLSAFFKRKELNPINKTETILQYRKLLRTYKANVYQSILTSLDFCEQCYQMIEDMKLYGISLEELPKNDDEQIERKHILSLLYPIPTWQDQENRIWNDLHNRDLSNVMILEHVWSQQDLYRIDQLKQCGAQMFSLKLKTPQLSYYHAINKRKEVEAFAQKLIAEKRCASDYHITVCDASYQPLVAQVFERYHIPFTILKQTSTSKLVKQTQCLLSYVYEPNMQSLLKLLELNAIKVSYRKEFMDYVTLFKKDLQDDFDHIQKHAVPSQLIEEDEIERLLRLEQRAKQCQEEILCQLHNLSQAKKPYEQLVEIDQLLKEAFDVQDSAAMSVLNQLHELFTVFLPYFHDRSDLPFLIELCDNIQANKQETSLHGALITDIRHPLIPEKTCVLFGCTQKNYPAFPIKKGLFDEAYLKQLAHYPDMNTRYKQYRKQLETILFHYEECIVFYPLGTYDGKVNESALEMEQYLNTSSSMLEPIQSYRPIPLRTEITEASAQALFVKNKELQSSISALERYGKCPFSYFLRYGLKVKEPIDYHFSQRRIGTLSHYLLEVLTERYGKAYAKANPTEIEALLADELHALSNVYPLLQPQIPLLKKRLLDSITANLHDLQDIEEHSALSPFACEQEFWWKLPLLDSISLKLHGFIDRIDANASYLRIMDYKSSNKKLEAKNVFGGLQLQLIVYALYAKHTWNKRVLGAFYWSMKKENVSIKAGKINRRSCVYQRLDEQDWEIQRKALKRLSGWVMHPDIEVMDDNGSHMIGVSQNKDGLIKAKKIYPIEELEDLFMEMLTQITKRILHGDIACNPTKDACKYCPYHDICRFHGYPREIEPLVDAKAFLGKGGE